MKKDQRNLKERKTKIDYQKMRKSKKLERVYLWNVRKKTNFYYFFTQISLVSKLKVSRLLKNSC